MSRNRMRNSQSLHWMGVLRWVLIAGLFSVLGLSYMVCKNQNLHLAEETHKLQLQLDAIRARNNELSLDLEAMKSQKDLERRLAIMRSSLVPLTDLRITFVPKYQNTRARVAQIGTLPKASVNMNLPPVAVNRSDAKPNPNDP